MQLHLFRSLWGWQGDWATCVAQLREAGCIGVEARLPMDAEARRLLGERLRADGLEYIAIVFTGGDVLPRQQDDPGVHLQHLARALDAALDGTAQLRPRFLNLLAGNDRWPLAQQVDFLGRAQAMADAAGVRCLFETHRASSLYSPWVTLDIIRQLPALRFTADISHWVVVCERLLDDPLDDLTPFTDRVDHVQARVAYAQGPQVPDPAAPEYAAELAFHQKVWAAVWARQRAEGQVLTTMTPEFGPDGYMHLLPYTRSPVADLWQVNRWMALEQRRFFDQWLSSSLPSPFPFPSPRQAA